MRVKKWITLLLSGAILAGSLAGCSRTIIEHQFHTNTVTDIEQIADDESKQSFVEKLENLLIFMYSKVEIPAVAVTIQFEFYEMDSEEYNEDYGNLGSNVDPSTWKAFTQGEEDDKGNYIYIELAQEYGDGSGYDDFPSACISILETIHNELQKVDEEWKIPEDVDGYSLGIYNMKRLASDTEAEKTFAVIQLGVV